ncbi:MAG: hypothetical protein KKB70_05535 [Proteobacteria bacterium]|nr:hypothetical protein [Pseudomonadota bacterium]
MLPEKFDHTRPAVVILHYGSPSRTTRLHKQLLLSDPDWAPNILVLDNQAPAAYPKAETWFRSTENLFWAGAFSLCVDFFLQHDVSHLWFFNNDLFFTSKQPFLKTALARLQRMEQTLGPVGLYSPAVLTSPYHPQMVARKGVQTSAISIADGISPLVALEAVQQVGGIDAADNCYGYGVDLWLSLRLHRQGGPLLVDHQVTVKHIYHSTARSVEGLLDTAARHERDYLLRRLGEGYQDIIDAAKRETKDFLKI